MNCILSVSHSPQKQGAIYEGESEYLLSQPITELVRNIMIDDGRSACMIDVGRDNPKLSYSREVLPRKAKRVNDIASSMAVNSFCCEIHLNSPGSKAGTAVLYHQDSTTGERIARRIQSLLEGFMGRGRYWNGQGGVISVPGPFWSSENKRLTFLSDTEPPAIIIELDSIRFGRWFREHIPFVSMCVANALGLVCEREQ